MAMAEPAISISVPARPTGQTANVRSVVFSFVNSATQATTSKTIDVNSLYIGCELQYALLVCRGPVPLTPGTYVATISTYSGPGGQGVELSQGQQAPFTITSSAQTIGISLGSAPKTIALQPLSPGVGGSQTAGFSFTGLDPAPYQFYIVALDAAGNTIAGPSAPALSATTSSPSFTAVEPAAKVPNVFSLTPVGTQNASATLSASTTAGGTATAKLTFAPYAADDWTTFAHDFQRTGQQTQTTGITQATVPHMKQRWTVQLQYDIFPSIVAYQGNVIVASAATVYDLSAATGQIVWQTVFQGGMDATPTLDVDDGLVFVGNRKTPGTFEALRLVDGSVAWAQTLPGTIRSTPVYAKGVVYEGWAGGDAPACLNGGVDAINARTGAIEWTWLTNPVTNPGGGGGIWGALAYDGSHVLFGTGNTCSASVNMQGAVAVNLNGSTDWAYVSDAQLGDDDDTGGGVMVSNGAATFINKNGNLYNVSIGTGQQSWTSNVNPHRGLGGFASPATDGSITVVGAGSIPSPPPAASAIRTVASAPKWNMCKPALGKRHPNEVVNGGYTSALVAVGPTGTLLWRIPMQSRIDAYAAINNDIAFIGMDTKMDAIDVQTGTVLWSFTDPSGGLFNAGAAVVPSGLYVGDANGNVYAFSLDPTTTAAPRAAGRR
jgi:hypothetical protein